MEYNHWFPPASEPYPDANSLNFSVSYARQPDEATHAFGNHRHGSDAHIADSSLLPATYPVPCLQDDERLVEFANIDLTPEFEKSYCQRILFVWRVVLHLCEANHDLAFRTWVKLLDGEGEDDIWLWADGDEKCIESSCNLRSDSPGPSRDELGWKLTNSDLHMGILALARRVDRVKGRVSEGLNITERRRRLHLAHPSLRFAAIAWSISMSEAVRHADASRGVLKRNLYDFFLALDDALQIRSPGQDAINFIESTTAHSEFRDYWDSMREAGHEWCRCSPTLTARWERWIYVKSLLSPNQDLDVTILKGLCEPECPGYKAIFSYRSLGNPQEPGSENSAINLQNTTGTVQPPATHLVLLWLFWKIDINDVINQEDKDRRSSYYRATDVRNWLQWLKSLATYSSSRCILSLMTSKCIEDWWSKILSGWDDDVDPKLVYLPWICSFYPCYRDYLVHVSHFDWECARRTMESVIAQNHGAVEGSVSGCSLDICGLFGALYFCSFPNGSGDPRVDVLNDIGRFKSMEEESMIMFKCRPRPTPAMIEFRSALRAAHPTCCRELGRKTIDAYSASITLLGLTDSVDHSTWKCKSRISCKSTSGLRRLLNHRKLPSGTSKQHLFDAAVRDLAEIAANEGLRFEIPTMNANANLNGSSLSHPEKHSTTDDRDTDSPRIADRSTSDTEQNSDAHTALRAGVASQSTSTITTLQKAIHLPKGFMVNAIKSHLIKLLEEVEIPLGGVKQKQLPWTTLTNILTERGFQLENWPSEVPLPGSGSQSCDDNKGINGLDKRCLVLLYEAVKSGDLPLKISVIARAPSSPIDGTTRITGNFTPESSSDVGGGGSLNITRKRGCEDNAGRGQRPNKRLHVTGELYNN